MRKLIILLVVAIFTLSFYWILNTNGKILPEDISKEDDQEVDSSINYHWDKVRKYKEYISEIENAEVNGKSIEIAEPFDVIPHLENLEKLGEINYENVTIKTLQDKRKLILDWYAWVNSPGNAKYIIEARAESGLKKSEFSFEIWYKLGFEELLRKWKSKQLEKQKFEPQSTKVNN